MLKKGKPPQRVYIIPIQLHGVWIEFVAIERFYWSVGGSESVRRNTTITRARCQFIYELLELRLHDSLNHKCHFLHFYATLKWQVSILIGREREWDCKYVWESYALEEIENGFMWTIDWEHSIEPDDNDNDNDNGDYVAKMKMNLQRN